jgi:hypothetical protein
MTRRSIADRMMQLVELPLEKMSNAELEQALLDIARA